MGQVGALPHRVEGVDQHLHAGQTALGDIGQGIGVQVAQVLGNQGKAGHIFQHIQQVVAGALLPVALPGILGSLGDGPVGMEGPEVVNAHHVIQPGHMGAPALPPGKAGLFVIGPVVQGIAPVLALVGKGIRGHAGHAGGAHILLQLEELRIAPHLGAVRRDIDGQVADDGDSLGVGVGLDRLPLAEEQILQEGLEGTLLSHFFPAAGHGLRLAQADLVGPLGQLLVKMGVQGHKEGVVRQPVGLLSLKLLQLRGVLLPAPFKGFPQQGHPGLVKPGIVHPVRIVPPGSVQLVGGEQALLRQLLQVQEQGVAREGRGGHIGGVAPSWRHQG